MTRVIVHIGRHGTGMRPIQRRLLQNRAALAENGVICPDPGGDAAWQQLEETAARMPQHSILLSGETLSRDARLAADLARRLRAIRPRVLLVVTLPSQLTLLPALWQDLARAGEPPDPGDFVTEALEHGHAAGVWLDYNRLLDQLLTGFSAQEIRFLDHATPAGQPGGVFAALLELALPGEGRALAARLSEGTTPEDTEREDTGTHPRATLAAWRIGGPGAADPVLAAQIAAWPGSAGQWLSRAEYDRIMQVFSPLNQAFLERIRPVQPDAILTGPPEPVAGTRFRDDMTAEFWADTAALLWRSSPVLTEPPETLVRGLRNSLRRVRNRILGTLPD